METIFPKWLVNSLGALLVLFVALLVVQKISDLKTSFGGNMASNTIAVTGMGKIEATPDLATVTLGVTSQGASAADVQSQNDTKINQVIAYIKQQGVPDSDIMTSAINLYPQQTYNNNNTPKITGYEADQTVTVKVEGVDKSTTVLDNVIDGSVTNGANEVDGVNLSLQDPSALQEQAQEAAIADAKQKAQKLADAAGLNLGKVVSVSESAGNFPSPLPFSPAMALSAGQASNSVAPTVQTGSQEIDETMTVTFNVN